MNYENWSTEIRSDAIVTQVEIKEKSSTTKYIFKSLEVPIFSVMVNTEEAIFATKNYFYDLLEHLKINASSNSLQTVVVDSVDLRNRLAFSSTIKGSKRNFVIIANGYILIIHTEHEPKLVSEV